MSTKIEDIEFLFQEEVLGQHGEYLMDILQEAIEEKNLIDKGILRDSLDYEVVSIGRLKRLSIKFPNYGRYIEIGKHRRRSKMDINTNRDIWGIRENSMRRKKNTDWYTKNAYKSTNRLIGMLMYEFTEQEIARLKRIIANRINLTI